MLESFGSRETEDGPAERVRDFDAVPERASFTSRQHGRPRPSPTSDGAPKADDPMMQMESGMVEGWLAAMKVGANRLLWTSVLFPACSLLISLVSIVHWRTGLF